MSAAPPKTPVDTTDGRRAGTHKSQNGDQDDVLLFVGEGDNTFTVTLAPSHARNLGLSLIQTADALDNEYPGTENR